MDEYRYLSPREYLMSKKPKSAPKGPSRCPNLGRQAGLIHLLLSRHTLVCYELFYSTNQQNLTRYIQKFLRKVRFLEL